MSALDPGFLNMPLAHRGLHDRALGRVENSRAAFAAAVEAGYGIELDVQMSSDGIPVVFHDETLDRLTALSGPVRHRTAEELAGTPLVGGNGDRIDTLQSVLEMVGSRASVLIEIKDQSQLSGSPVAALEQVVGWVVQNAVRDHGCKLAVMSFNPAYMGALTWLDPAVPRGLTGMVFDEPGLPAAVNAALSDYADFERTGCSFISHDRRTLRAPAVRRLKRAGVPVLCWTVRTPAQEAAARQIADNITFEGYLPERRGG